MGIEGNNLNVTGMVLGNPPKATQLIKNGDNAVVQPVDSWDNSDGIEYGRADCGSNATMMTTAMNRIPFRTVNEPNTPSRRSTKKMTALVPIAQYRRNMYNGGFVSGPR